MVWEKCLMKFMYYNNYSDVNRYCFLCLQALLFPPGPPYSPRLRQLRNHCACASWGMRVSRPLGLVALDPVRIMPAAIVARRFMARALNVFWYPFPYPKPPLLHCPGGFVRGKAVFSEDLHAPSERGSHGLLWRAALKSKQVGFKFWFCLPSGK